MRETDRVLSHIGTGEKNAVSAAELERCTGLNRRELRKIMECLRRSGHVIVSGNEGYYFPETVEEVRRHIRKENARARSIALTLESARVLERAMSGGECADV